MQIATRQLRQDDLIRGIGIIVDRLEVDEETNEATVFGHTYDRETNSPFATSVHLSAEHRVNVARRFQPGDRVTITNPAKFEDLYEDEETFDAVPAFLEAVVLEVNADFRSLRVAEVSETQAQHTVGFREARFVLA